MVLPPSPQTHEPLRFVLSEPAYVAAFVVYPGAGVRLLSPTVDAPERMRRGGYNVDQLIGASFDDDVYHAVLGPRLSGPAYLYVIASRRPLDVARYVHKPMSLASAIGQQESRSFFTDVAFGALLDNAVALGDETSWDADVYMLWPASESLSALPGGTQPAGPAAVQYMYLRCVDGSTRIVPVNYPFIGCPGQTHIRASDAAVRTVQQSASATVSSPTQRAGYINGAAASVTAPNTLAHAATNATEPVTVLPTIIGPRDARADRRAAVEREAGSQPLAYTVANGDQQAPAQAEGAAVRTQVEVIGTGDGRAIDRTRAQWRGRGDRSSPDHGARMSRDLDQSHAPLGTPGVPQLPPNPRLSPNPALPPSPRTIASPAQAESRRAEPSRRESRNDPADPAREMRRTEAPRMNPAMPDASARGVVDQNPGRVQRPIEAQRDHR
jgi:hypothetical protein